MMKVYTTNDIDKAFEWLEAKDDQAAQIIQEMDQEQPAVIGYIFSEAFEAFTSNEKELLLFATLVIYICTREEVSTQIALEDIEKAEDHNYSLLDESLTYEQQVDKYFKNTPQEDLLAMAEDMLSDDDEEDEYTVSPESRMPIFVTLKTIIDVTTNY